jgi:hypothetical protein
MYQLEVSDVIVKVPTRIAERAITHPVVRNILGYNSVTVLIVELGGLEYTCDIDNSVKLEDALDSLEQGIEPSPSEYTERRRELTSNRDVTDRYIILSCYLTTPVTCGLGIKAVGLDPNDSKQHFVNVTGSAIRRTRSE